MSNRFVSERKWSMFSKEISAYFKLKTNKVFLTFPKILIPKHFSDRVIDRFVKYDQKIIENIFYHLINYNLCEFLYWYKNKDYDSLDVIISNFRITFTRDKGNNIVARTIWNGDSSKKMDRLMKIYLKPIKKHNLIKES